ncbi:hypothetical protein NDU88_001358 [Pleurodeles waltl]|uniref:Uncharacterized protein n=1 Tax=Pleurodeles waltl TaxID=8319 RepID=A0AAV7NFI1_PLEWA|nr:hypothetical protein NDU88_001358 [Pleurodeles waltl]
MTLAIESRLRDRELRLPPAKRVAVATSDDGTGKCPGGTRRRRDPATSEYFRGQDDMRGQEQKTDSVSDGEGEGERGDVVRLKQEENSNPRKEYGAEEQGDAERQVPEEKSNARDEGDLEEQEQEGRGKARKDEDRESRCDGEHLRVKLGEGREDPDTRKP